MWWSKDQALALGGPLLARRRCLALAASLTMPAGLAACGFRPLYGGDRGDVAAADLAAIEVAAPLNRLGRILENQLIDDLNPAGLAVAKRYRLDVSLERNQKSLAIQLDDTVTRFDLTLAAFFSLRPITDAAPVISSVDQPADAVAAADVTDTTSADDPRPPPLYRSAVRRVATYNVIREPYATLVAEQDAERRAAVEVSREIRTLLTLFFETNPA